MATATAGATAKSSAAAKLGVWGAWLAVRKAHAFQAGGQGLQGGVQRVNFGPYIQTDNVHQVDGPVLEARAEELFVNKPVRAAELCSCIEQALRGAAERMAR